MGYFRDQGIRVPTALNEYKASPSEMAKCQVCDVKSSCTTRTTTQEPHSWLAGLGVSIDWGFFLGAPTAMILSRMFEAQKGDLVTIQAPQSLNPKAQTR